MDKKNINSLREVSILIENNGPTSSEIKHGWFHEWVDKKVVEPVPGYDGLQSWIPNREVTRTMALCETKNGKMIFVIPENLRFKNNPGSIEYPTIEEEIH